MTRTRSVVRHALGPRCADAIRALAAPAIAVLATVFAACSTSNRYQPPPPPAVTVSMPLLRPMTPYLRTTGTVAASRSVDLVARVAGYLRSVDFDDGSLVQAGQPLFLIEPEPYQARVQSAQAQLLNAQGEYERQLRLLQENATSRSNVDKWQAQREQALAALTLAKIDLGYTRITAPYAGRIGRHLVDPGNLVGAVGTPTRLATIEQVDPAYVYFTVNERDVLRIRAAARAQGVVVGGAAPRVPVSVALQTERDATRQGTLDFADTGLDTATGALQLRAEVPNADRALLPGVFVRVSIALGAASAQLVVPDRVVGNDQGGAYVLVLRADGAVVQQRVETGLVQDGLRAIVSGLEPASLVVVDGIQNAVPGTVVAPTEQPMAVPTPTSDPAP